MRKHLVALLTGSMIVISGLITPSLFADEGITPVVENGKLVFRNDISKPKSLSQTALEAQTDPQFSRILVYWSKAEHRWKPVSPPSPNVMRRARSAVDEVRQILAGRSYSGTYRMERVDVRARPSRKINSVAPDTRSLSRNGQVSQEEIDKTVTEAALRHDVDANLVRALIKVESNFNPVAISRKGAMGLMQLMPGTARSLNVTNVFDPRQNVDAGVRHLKKLLQDYNGNVPLTLAAYNAGSGAVQRNRGIPPYTETRNYVKKITHLYSNATPLNSALPATIVVSRDAAGHLSYTNQ